MRTLVVAVALLLQAMPADAQLRTKATAAAAVDTAKTVRKAKAFVAFVDVPSVIDLSLSEAEKAFGAVGLKATAVRSDGGTPAPDDIVLRQAPAPKQRVAVGTVGMFYVRPQVQLTPRVISLSLGDAIRLIKIAELRPNFATVPSPDTALGSVIQQDPPPGAPIRPDRTIDLQIAGVPQVVGLSVDVATVTLERANLAATTTVRELTEGNDGTVLEQSPEAGQAATPGSSVALTVGRVITTVEVPNFVGTRIDRVSSVSGADSLRIESRFSEPTRDAEDSVVTAQSPAPGTRVRVGSAITLTVSQREPPRLASLRIEPGSTSIVAHDSVRLTALGVMSDGSEIAVAPEWIASTGSISSDGRYVATGATGRVVVTARFAGLAATSVIRVVAKSPWWWIPAIVVGFAVLGSGVWRFIRWLRQAPAPSTPPTPPTPVPPLVFSYDLEAPSIETEIEATHGHGSDLSLVSYAGESVHVLEPAGAELFNEESTHG